MPRSRPPYPGAFRQQMVELVRLDVRREKLAAGTVTSVRDSRS